MRENGFGCVQKQSYIGGFSRHLKPILASKTNTNKFGGFRVYENCLGASKTNLIRIWRLIDRFSVIDYENGF
jgi:hypothetical protein